MFVANYVFSFVFNLIAPVQQEYAGNPVFRPWSDPLMSLMFLHPFILGIILTWFWKKLNLNWWKFTLAIWIFSFPGMLISYSTFPISLLMVLSWYLSMLAESVCASLIFAKFLKNNGQI